jgi:hypothetical protein
MVKFVSTLALVQLLRLFMAAIHRAAMHAAAFRSVLGSWRSNNTVFLLWIIPGLAPWRLQTRTHEPFCNKVKFKVDKKSTADLK